MAVHIKSKKVGKIIESSLFPGVFYRYPSSRELESVVELAEGITTENETTKAGKQFAYEALKVCQREEDGSPIADFPSYEEWDNNNDFETIAQIVEELMPLVMPDPKLQARVRALESTSSPAGTPQKQ